MLTGDSSLLYRSLPKILAGAAGLVNALVPLLFLPFWVIWSRALNLLQHQHFLQVKTDACQQQNDSNFGADPHRVIVPGRRRADAAVAQKRGEEYQMLVAELEQEILQIIQQAGARPR
jgi:hypothetical protein